VLDSRANGGKRISADLLDLVKRCRDGDADAWRTLLPHFQAIGRRALRSFRLSAADSDDVLSDTLASLYGGGLSQFRGETLPQVLAFLKVVVRNRAIDLVNERRKWSPAAAPSHAEAGESSTDVAQPGAGDFVDDIADDECLEFLRQEVGRLKREDRELYLMKARGMKEREIAEQTGRPPGTVASQIARLLERLRSALRERGCL
jgi:RNA polymerase sigma factor (sigma-70 family)